MNTAVSLLFIEIVLLPKPAVLFTSFPCTGRPEKWTKLQVAKWIDSICDDYEMDKEEVIDLKKANGRGLDTLDKEDWLRRSPTQGDLLYKLWKQLKGEKNNDMEELQKQKGIVLC